MQLTLLAHAATAATRTASFPADDPLDAPARAQAEARAGSLRRVDAAWTSPARAARQTAEALGLHPAIDPALRDLDPGAWSGRTLADLAETDPVPLAAFLADPAAPTPGGDSVQSLIDRIAAWLAPLETPARTLAITHAAILRAALVIALDAPAQAFWRIDVPPLTRLILQRRQRTWTLRTLSPLQPPRAPC